MADDSKIEKQAEEIENKDEIDENKEPTPEKTEEIPAEKVALQLLLPLAFVQCTKLYVKEH